MIAVCARCECTETTPCVNDAGQTCASLAPGLCSFCIRIDVSGARDVVGQLPTVTLLEFERAHPGGQGKKAEAVRKTFGMSLTRWYQQLTVALRTREALEHDAAFTRYLTDRLDARMARRAALTRVSAR